MRAMSLDEAQKPWDGKPEAGELEDARVDERGSVRSAGSETLNEDDRELEALGYKPSFKREFSNLATVRTKMDCMFSDVRLTSGID